MSKLNYITLTFCAVSLVILSAFQTQKMNDVKYVALGDSYTICTGAEPKAAWPILLTKHLNEAGIKTELVANPSVNGYSTQNLIDKELAVFDKSEANFVTLLIGVNDWVREVDADTYTKNLQFILNHIQSKLSDQSKILLITIPDFGVTPQGKNYGRGRNISEGIQAFNAIIKKEGKNRGLKVVDIFEISKEMGNNPKLVASDGLHPSVQEYTIWESLIFPIAKSILGK